MMDFCARHCQWYHQHCVYCGPPFQTFGAGSTTGGEVTTEIYPPEDVISKETEDNFYKLAFKTKLDKKKGDKNG